MVGVNPKMVFRNWLTFSSKRDINSRPFHEAARKTLSSFATRIKDKICCIPLSVKANDINSANRASSLNSPYGESKDSINPLDFSLAITAA